MPSKVKEIRPTPRHVIIRSNHLPDRKEKKKKKLTYKETESKYPQTISNRRSKIKIFAESKVSFYAAFLGKLLGVVLPCTRK